MIISNQNGKKCYILLTYIYIYIYIYIVMSILYINIYIFNEVFIIKNNKSE